jgi:hypothetical protein
MGNQALGGLQAELFQASVTLNQLNAELEHTRNDMRVTKDDLDKAIAHAAHALGRPRQRHLSHPPPAASANSCALAGPWRMRSGTLILAGSPITRGDPPAPLPPDGLGWGRDAWSVGGGVS